MAEVLPVVILLMCGSFDALDALYDNVGELPIIITDPYYTHRGIPTQSMVKWFVTKVLDRWSQVATSRGARLWLVTPCFSMVVRSKDERGGYRMVNPQTAHFGPWAGLAYGATGFYLFVRDDYHCWGRSALTRLD